MGQNSGYQGIESSIAFSISVLATQSQNISQDANERWAIQNKQKRKKWKIETNFLVEALVHFSVEISIIPPLYSIGCASGYWKRFECSVVVIGTELNWTRDLICEIRQHRYLYVCFVLSLWHGSYAIENEIPCNEFAIYCHFDDVIIFPLILFPLFKKKLSFFVILIEMSDA